MDCRTNQGLLVAYFDEELSGRERDEVKAHLASCPVCRELAGKLSLGVEVFKSVNQAEALAELSPYLARRIAARAMEERHAPRPWRLKFGFAFGAAALVGLGLFAGYIIRSQIHTPGNSESLSITFNSNAIGFEIDGDNFILHSRDKRGENGIDLKF